MTNKILVLCTFKFLCFTSSYAITADDILREARKHINSDKWSYASCHKLLCGKNKCNIFVDDVLSNVGAKRPKRDSFFYPAIGANEWGKSNSEYILNTGCYQHIPSFSNRQKGDVIAFPVDAGSGHVGIVSTGSQYVSAGQYIVEEKDIPTDRSRTIWRYRYTKTGC
ncbi:uncharacterized protein LOC133186035 [Saccostrea echinata]|uniref:uncharacterized protein LOC133186035 n=1 Tax=Saccostrea echinata TaxID=191078 RepID=UPI002A809907|nr:uncharacterized protein LOC133186035 [Saccostrea echinata]